MRNATSVAVLMLAVAWPQLAAASPKSVADKTFKRGRELMGTKQYAEACAAFEQSQQLDPQFGTLFNLAECDVQLGKVTAAWKIYRELALGDPNVDRKKISADTAAQLEKDMPRVMITVAAHPAQLAVQIDGTDSTALVGVATPVDLGTHAVTARAPGFRDWTGTFDAAMGRVDHVTVQLDPLDASDAPRAHGAAPPGPVDPTAPHADLPPCGASGSASRARTGKLVALGGGVTVAAGLVIGGLAYSDYHAAESCTDCDKHDQSHHATVLGDVSTAVVIVGLVPVAAGLYLWRTSSSAAVIAPQVGSDHVGAAIVGRF